MTEGEIHPLSFSIVRLSTTAPGSSVGSGTGFLVDWRGGVALVTNYHVLTRRDTSGRPIDPGSLPPLPTRINFVAPAGSDRGGGRHFRSIEIDLPLYADLDNHAAPHDPKFLHLPLDEGIDLALFPFGRLLDPGQPNFWTVTVPTEVNRGKDLRVMDRVTVAGFPNHVPTPLLDTPIYKSGFVASEPALTPASYWIDGKTRPGMSGSPVIRNLDNRNPAVASVGPSETLVGVYSGRDHDASDLNEMELGKVWSIDSLRRLLDLGPPARTSTDT